MPHQALPLILVAALTACGSAPETVLDGEARSADGVVIRYEVRGRGEPALVLVHGWTNSREIWGEHLQTLARAHRVVALDLAGHGASGADRRDWTIEAFARDVEAVVEQQDLARVVLVGFSMGGPVVLQAAELLEDHVLGVVFVDTFKDPDRPLPEAEFEGMLEMFRTHWGDTAFIRAFAYTPDAPDSLVRKLVAEAPPEPREHWFTVARAMHSWMHAESRPALARARVPVAAINTTAPPTNVEAMRRYIPSFTVDTIGGVGHAGILHRRIEEFDTRLLALVARFQADADG